jgi:hypothetical protein
MIDAGSRCPNCGALYALVGTVHRCAGKPAPTKPARQSHQSHESESHAESHVEKSHAESHGRAPWELEGVSRATWFRRRAEEKSAREQAP